MLETSPVQPQEFFRSSVWPPHAGSHKKRGGPQAGHSVIVGGRTEYGVFIKLLVPLCSLRIGGFGKRGNPLLGRIASEQKTYEQVFGDFPHQNTLHSECSTY